MTMDMISEYRASMFDGTADVNWLRQGWRGLRFYGRKAKAAIETGDISAKAMMIARADELLNLMCGILDTSDDGALGPALLTVYSALRFTLLRANTENSTAALDDFEAALSILDHDMAKASEGALAA
jgi:flagellin-specific chaperone FliS